MISAIRQLWYYALAYVIGGVTFIPLCLLLFLIFATSPRKKCTLTTQAEPQSDDESALHTDEEFKVGELEELKGVETFKRGWLYVTNKYYYHSSELVGAAGQDKDSLPTRDKLKRKKRFYAVLKHGNLFLYKTDAESTDVSQVIVLKNSFVTIWPRDTSMELLDASLFTNKTCISICKNGKAYVGENGRLKFAESSPVGVIDQYFIYLENNVEKEDWYFALINASKITQTDSILDPTNSATTAHLRTKDMMSLLQTVNATEGQFATKWLNALVNRLFLSLQQTETLHGILKEKIHKKLTKINKPGFLDDFKIEHVDVGTSAPIITNPKLLELSPEGSTRVRFNMQYRGNLSLIVSTKVNINLGSRFKSREVTIELAITVKEVDGPIIVLVKPPPSNRLWYAFESDPVLNIDIEPIVSTRQFSYNMITNVIKSKFKEAIHESIVLPYMDDIVFYSTQDEVYRGGIWLHETKKRQEKNDVPEQTEDDVVTTPYNGNLYKSETTLFAAPTESKAPAATQPAERKDSVISPSASYEDDVATLSLRKPTDSIHSSDSDSASERGSIISLGESSLKTKTMHRVGTLKNMIKARASNDGSIRSLDSNSPVDTSGSKKYFQSGMKKIGRWYRDQVNNAKDAVHDSQIDGMHRFDTSVFVQEAPKQGGPEMISNRRSNPRLKSQSDIKDDFLKLPSESSADMFVNRARATSFDSPKSPNIPNAYPFVPQSPIGSVSPDSVPSRRLSINSQVEQASSSELTQMEEFSRKMDESLTNVPEKEESTRITKEMDIFSPSASYPLTTVDTIDPLDTAAELSTKLKEDTGIAFDLISEQVQESKSAIDKPARNESVASAVEIAARVCPPELPPRPQT